MHSVTKKVFEQVVFGNPVGCDRKDGLWGLLHGRWYKTSSSRSVIPANFSITPSAIVRTGFCGVFGRMECENFAEKLVLFAQARKGWEPLTLDNLEQFSPSPFNGENLVFFERLGFLANKDGVYSFTLGFVLEVWEYSQQ